MGNQKQPIDLMVAKGRKHLTKSEIAERKATEIRAPSNNIKPPSWLDRKQKKEFKKIAKTLLEIGIFSDLDCDCLARYIKSSSNYIKITEKLEQHEPTKMVKQYKKDKEGNILDEWETEVIDGDYDSLMLMQDRAFKQCRQAASDLGLSISSRCKLVMPKVEVVKPENKFGKFVKNG